jgi:tyrosyl-tRNA synthetase
MLLQAYDFAHLYRERGVELQMGGADQWGNITAGLELIRRTGGAGTEDGSAHGLAYRLLLSPSGSKFGKSEGDESVWLDPARTSPYDFYQYWRNVDDRDVGTYLRWFTEFPREQIEALDAETETHPDARAAQLALASDITARTYGAEAAARAVADSAVAFAAGPVDDPTVLASLYGSAGGFEFDRAWLASGIAVLLAEAGLCASRGEARRLIAGGGVTVNGERVTETDARPVPIAGEWLDVRIGKRRREIGRAKR